MFSTFTGRLCGALLVLYLQATEATQITSTFSTQVCNTNYDSTSVKPVPRTTFASTTHSHSTTTTTVTTTVTITPVAGTYTTTSTSYTTTTITVPQATNTATATATVGTITTASTLTTSTNTITTTVSSTASTTVTSTTTFTPPADVAANINHVAVQPQIAHGAKVAKKIVVGAVTKTQFPTMIACTRTVTLVTITGYTVTTTATSTAVGTSATVIATSVSTITSYVTPSPASTTVTATVTSTSTTSTTIVSTTPLIVTSYTTTTTTSTSSATVTTQNPACTNGNLSPGGDYGCSYNVTCGYAVTGLTPSSYSYQWNLHNCAEVCDNDANCQAVNWEVATGNCSVFDDPSGNYDVEPIAPAPGFDMAQFDSPYNCAN